jgi:hypothetical protein
VKLRVPRWTAALALVVAMVVAVAPAGAKPKPKHPRPAKHKPVKPTAAERAAAARFVKLADAFSTGTQDAPLEHIPAVDAEWATCSASYPELTATQVSQLEDVIENERALPKVATLWKATLASWHGVKTANPTLKAVVALADSEVAEVEKLVASAPQAICDFAATWKVAEFSDEAFDAGIQVWVDALGIDTDLTDRVSSKLDTFDTKLRALGVSADGLQTLHGFFL